MDYEAISSTLEGDASEKKAKIKDEIEKEASRKAAEEKAAAGRAAAEQAAAGKAAAEKAASLKRRPSKCVKLIRHRVLMIICVLMTPPPRTYDNGDNDEDEWRGIDFEHEIADVRGLGFSRKSKSAA